MNDVDKMLVKQFLLRVRQEGFTIVEKPPRSISGLNIDIYRGQTKICTFDDRQLGERWNLRLHTYDSTRAEIKQDFYKLFNEFIHLRNLYSVYETATPLQGYDHSLGYREIMQHNHCVLAVNGRNSLGELEFGTFFTDRSLYGTVITKKPLEIGDKGFADIQRSDFTLNPEKRPTLREFQPKAREYAR